MFSNVVQSPYSLNTCTKYCLKFKYIEFYYFFFMNEFYMENICFSNQIKRILQFFLSKRILFYLCFDLSSRGQQHLMKCLIRPYSWKQWFDLIKMSFLVLCGIKCLKKIMFFFCNFWTQGYPFALNSVPFMLPTCIVCELHDKLSCSY